MARLITEEGRSAVTMGSIRRVAAAPLRQSVLLLDRIMRRAQGVYEFSNDFHCVVRIRVTQATHRLALPDVTVEPGDRVVEVHLWNEKMMLIPQKWNTLRWALIILDHFLGSLKQLARYVEETPELADAVAFGGVSFLLTPDYAGTGAWMTRLGFTILPYHSPLGRFGEFMENMYGYWLMWAYNPASAQRRHLFGTQRRQMWMSREAFLERFGVPDEVDLQRG